MCRPALVEFWVTTSPIRRSSLSSQPIRWKPVCHLSSFSKPSLCTSSFSQKLGGDELAFFLQGNGFKEVSDYHGWKRIDWLYDLSNMVDRCIALSFRFQDEGGREAFSAGEPFEMHRWAVLAEKLEIFCPFHSDRACRTLIVGSQVSSWVLWLELTQ